MLPHIITSQIDEAEANAAGLRDAAGNCSKEQPALRARLLSGAQALENVCKLARELGLAAVLNRDAIINRRAS
jgi:hypothetical protein